MKNTKATKQPITSIKLKDFIRKEFGSIRRFAELTNLTVNLFFTYFRKSIMPEAFINKLEERAGINIDYFVTGKGSPIKDEKTFNLLKEKYNVYYNKTSEKYMFANAVVDDRKGFVSTQKVNAKIEHIFDGMNIFSIQSYCTSLEIFGIPQGSTIGVSNKIENNCKVIFVYQKNLYIGTIYNDNITMPELGQIINKDDAKIIGRVVCKIVFF